MGARAARLEAALAAADIGCRFTKTVKTTPDVDTQPGWSRRRCSRPCGVPTARAGSRRTAARFAARAVRGRSSTASGALDLRPRTAAAEQTKYLDEALHVDRRHESIAPPLLGSKVRNDMLRAFLDARPGGPGDRSRLRQRADARLERRQRRRAGRHRHRAVLRARGDRRAAISIMGDLRRLPLRSGAFTKAWSLDVLEHLSRPALVEMLGEANRVLADGGAAVRLHARAEERLGRRSGPARSTASRGVCERVGLIDLRQERLRKSDHVNPLVDHDDLRRVVRRDRIRDRAHHLLHAGRRRVHRERPRADRRARAHASRRPRDRRADARRRARRPIRRPPSRAVRVVREGDASGTAARRIRALRALSALMRLDVWLFGRMRSGPFFALLRKSAASDRDAGHRRAALAGATLGSRSPVSACAVPMLAAWHEPAVPVSLRSSPVRLAVGLGDPARRSASACSRGSCRWRFRCRRIPPRECPARRSASSSSSRFCAGAIPRLAFARSGAEPAPLAGARARRAGRGGRHRLAGGDAADVTVRSRRTSARSGGTTSIAYFVDSHDFGDLHLAVMWIEGLMLAVAAEPVARCDPAGGTAAVRMAVVGAAVRRRRFR